MPKFSIIMPVYNCEQFLSQCFDCILSQSEKDLEVIVVDDGSTDHSREICFEYAQRDERVKVLSGEHRGVSEARNLALEHSSGQWVTFIDSDDAIEPRYFELKGLDKADLVVQSWRYCNKSASEKLEPLYYDGQRYLDFMSENACLCVFRMIAAKFMRLDIIRQNRIRFMKDVKLGEDTIFMLQYLIHCRSVQINNHSHYLYYRPDEKDWTKKYSLTENNYIISISAFHRNYMQLPFQSQSLAFFFYWFLFGFIPGHNILTTKLRILTHPAVSAFRKECIIPDSTIKMVIYGIYDLIASVRKKVGRNDDRFRKILA